MNGSGKHRDVENTGIEKILERILACDFGEHTRGLVIQLCENGMDFADLFTGDEHIISAIPRVARVRFGMTVARAAMEFSTWIMDNAIEQGHPVDLNTPATATDLRRVPLLFMLCQLGMDFTWDGTNLYGNAARKLKDSLLCATRGKQLPLAGNGETLAHFLLNKLTQNPGGIYELSIEPQLDWILQICPQDSYKPETGIREAVETLRKTLDENRHGFHDTSNLLDQILEIARITANNDAIRTGVSEANINTDNGKNRNKAIHFPGNGNTGLRR